MAKQISYHDAIIDLIQYILQKDSDYLSLLDSGNAYDKILRNYHQFNLEGYKVYRNLSLMKLHYRYTKEAWAKNNELKELYFEHLVPLKLIKNDLRSLTGADINQQNIRAILNKTEIVVLTRVQANTLDGKYKSELPDGGVNRLEIMNYQIEPLTVNNSIFELKK
jgi:hypothetical protein